MIGLVCSFIQQADKIAVTTKTPFSIINVLTRFNYNAINKVAKITRREAEIAVASEVPLDEVFGHPTKSLPEPATAVPLN